MKVMVTNLVGCFTCASDSFKLVYLPHMAQMLAFVFNW